MAKHISIRVPWHDNEWSGSVCKCPENNPFCMVLRNIADSKNVDNEMGLAGRKGCELSSEQLPACKGGENGGFYVTEENREAWQRFVENKIREVMKSETMDSQEFKECLR